MKKILVTMLIYSVPALIVGIFAGIFTGVFGWKGLNVMDINRRLRKGTDLEITGNQVQKVAPIIRRAA